MLLLDIEGTTTPITFVKDVLFPFAHERVEQYLDDTWETEQTRGDVRALYDQYLQDKKVRCQSCTAVQRCGEGIPFADCV